MLVTNLIRALDKNKNIAIKLLVSGARVKLAGNSKGKNEDWCILRSFSLPTLRIKFRDSQNHTSFPKQHIISGNVFHLNEPNELKGRSD